MTEQAMEQSQEATVMLIKRTRPRPLVGANIRPPSEGT
jgi:hypothetical protein